MGIWSTRVSFRYSQFLLTLGAPKKFPVQKPPDRHVELGHKSNSSEKGKSDPHQGLRIQLQGGLPEPIDDRYKWSDMGPAFLEWPKIKGVGFVHLYKWSYGSITGDGEHLQPGIQIADRNREMVSWNL